NCKDHRELLLAAETNMNKMKNLPSNEITDQIYKRAQEEVSPITPRVVKRNDNEVQEIDLDEQIAEMINSQS
ncbi:MAG: hypothetical protein IKS48_09025, partial [Eubacterium sp.]|nr:hypothetical protein [Eubacterium sp.]